MRSNIRKQFIEIASAILTLAAATATHAVTEPIQTERGVFRLGSKTQANVNAKQSSADLGQGIILVSSNPARMGRPTLKVRFNGAPMHAKVQGTALIAYLRGQFIQITGVEGRTYLVREGRLGEVVAVDAGKMLLVKPTAKRLPDTVDVNLSDFVKNSPMFNGGLQLAASELIARAIEKQSKNRYLKPTPIYLEGAGTEAVIAEGLGDEGQPFDSSLTGIDAIERIPRQVEGAQRGPEQLVALQTGGSSGAGFNGGGGGGFNGPGGGGINGPDGDGGIPGPNDSPGAPSWGSIASNTVFDRLPSRGFQKEFTGTNNIGSFWFPITEPNWKIRRTPVSNPSTSLPLVKTGRQGLVQGALRPGTEATYLIFPEARITDPMTKTAFKITPDLGGTSSIILKFSNDDIPSDILTSSQFRDAFQPATEVIVSDTGLGTRDTEQISVFAPLDKTQNPPTLEMTLVVPPEGITIKAPFFKTDTITQPSGGSDPFPIVGLDAPRFMGSVLVDVTRGGPGVKVEVGDRQGSNALEFPDDTDERSRLGTFSLQAPPSESVAGGMLTIKSDGPLNITDPNPVSDKRSLAQTKVVSRQSVNVQGTSGDLELSQAELRAGQGIGVRSAGALNFSKTKLNAGQGIEVSSPTGALNFSKTELNAGQGIEVSSPTRIRFENSSQLVAVTDIIMQGAGTADLEVVNSTVRAPNGRILLDEFDRIQVEGATLMASVIRARVLSPSGVLQINNSTLTARELLRLYAEGSSGMVEFNGTVRLTGRKIDIAGNTVRVNSGGKVNTAGNTTVYANGETGHDYNKPGKGVLRLDRQKGFDERPDFHGN